MLPDRTLTNMDVGRTFPPGTVLGGRYEIVTLAGAGAMGIVYKAHDRELGVDVALKVLRSDLATDPRFVERFRRELLLARQVVHRNVVRIHDIGESDGVRFLTMTYVEGESLLELLERDGPIEAERATVIVQQLADALQHAHDAGVVHRDLKPGNILIGADGSPYITDFGVARSAGRSELTRAGAVVGTPDYLSPEQVAGEPVDHRSDIYALGIVFYEMLTGKLPFPGESQGEILAHRLTGRVRDVRHTGRHVPRHVRAAITRSLERRPSRRYQQARELAADLSGGSARRFRRPAWQAAAVVVAVAGVAAALAITGGEWPMLRTPQGNAAPAGRRSLAVLPLADETADPALAWAGTGVSDMVAAKLSESPELRVLDTQRVFRILRDLGLTDGRYDDDTIRQLAELLDVDALVTGTVRRGGETVRIDLRLVERTDASGSGGRHASAESPAASGVFASVNQLAERLRTELGAAQPREPQREEPNTGSLEAARAYHEGRTRLAVGDYVAAVPALERAIGADPGFTAAMERLGEAYQNLGYRDKALAAVERAARTVEGNRSRLASRVRARLALLRGEPEAAEKEYAELAARYPRDTELLLDLAAAQAAHGEIARAVDTLKKATAIDHNDPRAWFLLGKNTILSGDSGRALNDYLVRALALQKQLKNEQGEGDVLNAIGVAYHQLGEYARALEHYSASAAIRERLHDDRGTATSLKNRARVYLAMSRLAEAEPDLRRAQAMFERIGDRTGLADVMNDFGVLFERRGAYADALRHYESGLKIRRTLGDGRLLAQSHDNVGYIHFVVGEYDEAAIYWREALDVREQIGEKSGIILSMQNMGFLHTAQGRWTAALKSFLDALERSRAIDFKNAMAVSFGNVGVLQHYQGRYDAALSSLDEALAILNGLGDKRGLAEFAMKQVGVLLDVGALEEAQRKLDAAEPVALESGNREQLADFQVLSAHLSARGGDREAARRALARAAEHARSSRSRLAQLRVRIAKGAIAEELADHSAAVALLPAALGEAEAIGDVPLQLRAREPLARARAARGEWEQAEAVARAALSQAARSGWEAGRFRLHLLLATTLERRGDGAAAAVEYREGANRAGKLREAVPAALRARFSASPMVRELDDWLERQAPVRAAAIPKR
jgi:tetratricopeptide (TPR) repeat protein/TolB-like protein